jgi:hypothetical protein
LTVYPTTTAESSFNTEATREHRSASTLGFVLAGTLLCVSWFFYSMRVELFQPPSTTLLPQPVIEAGQMRLLTPGYVVTAELAAYEDELFAFLMFDHLRSDKALDGLQLRLHYDRRRASDRYRLILVGGDDLLHSVASVRSLQYAGTPGELPFTLTPSIVVHELEKQTELFVSAYNLPVRQKLETLPRQAIENYLRRFIRFKSNTDPRIRRRMDPMPQPLSSQEAQRLAGDIITIAEFYSLPLEFLLGIGAMENNYMNVRGDLNHSIWKRKPAPDDVVLERRRGRVRILNDSAGVWQITRETLRFAHSLYRKDTRDYGALPEHLRPPDELRINEVSPQVLTTYAGLILRDLLDRFEGDVTLAVSAYNGGPARPNLRYGAGVHRAASHARRVLEQAAALNGESVVNMTWIRRP